MADDESKSTADLLHQLDVMARVEQILRMLQARARRQRERDSGVAEWAK